MTESRREAWRRIWTTTKGDMRCPELDPLGKVQCSLMQGHDPEFGHEGDHSIWAGHLVLWTDGEATSRAAAALVELMLPDESITADTVAYRT